MVATRNVVALALLVALPGCLAQTSLAQSNSDVDEAMAIANSVDGDGPTSVTDKLAMAFGLGPDKKKDEKKEVKKEEEEDKDEKDDDEEESEDEAPPKNATVEADAKNAHKAAKVAKEAATVAKKVATHSIEMAEHAKSALKNAHDAVNRARVDSQGLSSEQKKSLKDAEKQLRQATKAAEYGQIKDAKYVKAKVENKKLQNLEDKMAKKKKQEKEKENSELEAMRKEIEELRKKLKENNDNDDEEALKELEDQIAQMEKAEKKEDKATAKSHDEVKAEIERLRDMIKDLQKEQEKPVVKRVPKVKKEKKEPEPEPEPVEPKGLDVDTAMPYGDLEPFGREDTAQELTENSIHESDRMVDQLERAEVAEEKRSVFRALTRLRGAAITSYDGVARSQTGNIDEYNKLNQWRAGHPLHHLADEESDVSKWAFPDNAD